MEWQPIETAPKDGTSIILYEPNRKKVQIGKWDNDRWAKKPRPYWAMVSGYSDKTYERMFPPTHWQPLPPSPTESTPDAAGMVSVPVEVLRRDTLYYSNRPSVLYGRNGR